MHVTEREGDCWRCAERVGLSAFCSSCEAPQPLPPGADHFAVLGVPRGLALDRADLERRYHEASRRVHPDRHQTAGLREQELSLAASAALNRAYRTLREPVARGRYWLELHGDAIGLDNNRVPPDLADMVFEVQEQLAELRAGHGDTSAIRAARGGLAERLGALVAGLEVRYRALDDPTAPAALADLKRVLSEIAYLRTLVRDVDAGLSG
jgi:molecular chaperone HscB